MKTTKSCRHIISPTFKPERDLATINHVLGRSYGGVRVSSSRLRFIISNMTVAKYDILEQLYHEDKDQGRTLSYVSLETTPQLYDWLNANNLAYLWGTFRNLASISRFGIPFYEYMWWQKHKDVKAISDIPQDPSALIAGRPIKAFPDPSPFIDPEEPIQGDDDSAYIDGPAE
jgi:hypothetical protein